MSWFGTPPKGSLRSALIPVPAVLNGSSLLLSATPFPGTSAGTGRPSPGRARGARHNPRGPGASRYALLDRVRGKRWGELPAAPPAGRHTSPVRFVTERAGRVSAPGVPARPTSRPGVVIIARPCDLLAQLVATSLIYAHVPTCQLDPSDLPDVELEWHGDVITITGQPVRGLLWRTLTCPGPDRPATAETDSDSYDPPVTASWLAAASFPSMRAVNAYDAEAWRRGAGWRVWKDRLSRCGVPVESPEQPSESPGVASLVVCGRVVSGPETPAVEAAAEALEASGVRLASVTSLPDGRVSNVDPHPQAFQSVAVRRAATRIADYLAA